MRFRSSPDSVKNNEPTWMAIIETVLAIAAYWGIAIYWETHLHLLISICVAPLLLLRSPQSTEAGARWFYDYWTNKTEISPKKTPLRFWAIILLAAGISGLASYFLATYLLPGHEGWSLFGRALLLGILAIIIAQATVYKYLIVINRVVNTALSLAVAAVAAIAVAIAIAGMGEGVEVKVWAGVIAICGVVTAAVAQATGIMDFIVIAVTFGLWLHSLATRTFATLRYLWPGILNLPDNWRHAILVIDSFYPPELIPGLEKLSDEFSFQSILTSLRSDRVLVRVVGLIFTITLFFPAMLYRWSLKSTAWLYLPLLYIYRGRNGPRDGGKMLLSDLCDDAYEVYFRRIMAGIIIITTLSGLISLPRLLGMHEAFPHAPILLYLWVFDFSQLSRIPYWQLIAMPSAFITWGLFFFAHRTRRRWGVWQKSDPSAIPDSRHISWLHWAVVMRSLCTIVSLLLAFGYVALALGLPQLGADINHLPGGLAFLKTIYGPYLP
jgi:hypothetical protein